MGLTVKLPATVVGAILLTAIIGGVASVALGRDALQRAVLANMQQSAELYAAAVLTHVDGARAMLGVSATLLQLASPPQAREVAARVLAHSAAFEYILLLQPDGTVAMVEPPSLEQQLSQRDLSSSEWFKEVHRVNREVVSDLHISPLTQRPAIVLATPVRAADGRVVGIWAGALRLGLLSKIGHPPSPDSDRAEPGYLTDRRGLVIAHQSRPEFVESRTDLSSMLPVKEALAGRSGASEFFNTLENERKIAGYAPLPGLGWAAVFRVPTAAALASASELTRSLLLASLALAVLFGLGVFLSIRRTFAPLVRLVAATRDAGAGNFSQRIKTDGRDEIGHLEQAFNQMVDTLAARDAEVRSRGRELARSNAELEQFAYVASHDLQEPLRMVVGYVQLLEKRLAGKLDTETREFMALAVDGALRMQQLILDILAYSRVGATAQLHAPVDSAAALQEALALLAGPIADSGAKVSAQPLPTVLAHRMELVQVFQNLIGNALKFCKGPTPLVDVNAIYSEGWWRFSVADNGIGIAPEYRGQLFVIFKRLHTRREYPGTGIGLAICKRIITHHGGDIGIETAPQGGALFWFTLPAAPAP